MQRVPVTQYSVDSLVTARTFAHRVKSDTRNDPHPKSGEHALRIELRRADAPTVDIGLELYAKLPEPPPPGLPSVERPSASLRWQNERIRCVDHKLKHPAVENGIQVAEIRGFHEHFWTEADKGNRIREVTPPMKNHDLQAVLNWCAD